MEKSKIDRINELAHKAKTSEGLTNQEKQEQASLRREYIESYKANLIGQLENTYLVDEKGNKKRLERKKNV